MPSTNLAFMKKWHDCKKKKRKRKSLLQSVTSSEGDPAYIEGDETKIKLPDLHKNTPSHCETKWRCQQNAVVMLFFSIDRKLIGVHGKIDGANNRAGLEGNMLDAAEDWRLTFYQHRYHERTAWCKMGSKHVDVRAEN